MNIKHIYNEVKYYFKTYGLWKTIKKCLVKIKRIILRQEKWSISSVEVYHNWIKNNEPNDEELEEQKKYKFEIQPKISIIVPMYNTPVKFFEELVDCLINQTYRNWELCLADGSPEQNHELDSIIEKDKRIKYKFLNENKGIPGNTNAALSLATGDYVALLDHDDTLPLFCLYEIVKCINENTNVEFIYSDEDKIVGKKAERRDPYFKPDFSPDTLRANNYITHLSVFKKSLMDKIGGFRDDYNGAQDFDVIIRATENTKNIVHIPKILYHWRVHENSTAMAAGAKPYAYEAGQRVVEDHLKRIGAKGSVKPGGDIPGIYEVEYDVIRKSKSFNINSKQRWNKIIKEVCRINFKINYI